MKLFTEKQLQSFNDLDYSIYNFIVSNSQKASYMTIRELADEAHVSTASITRFCQKVGCEGYTEFKVRFKIQIEETKKVIFENDITDIEAFFNRVKTEEYEKEVLKISQVLSNAKSLIFVGTGNSGVMAKYAARYFSSVGKFALHVDNPMFQISIESPNDTVLVMFSVEGELGNIVENLTKLKSQNATIVSITNSKNSTLAKLSNYNLSYYVQRENNHNTTYHEKVDVTTQVPVLFLIETLAKEVYKIQEQKEHM